MNRTVHTLEAYLPSHGYNNRKATLHRYAHSERVTKTINGMLCTGIGHFYRCIETSELRQWGFDQGPLGSGIN
jgi:hypothetical protein